MKLQDDTFVTSKCEAKSTESSNTHTEEGTIGSLTKVKHAIKIEHLLIYLSFIFWETVLQSSSFPFLPFLLRSFLQVRSVTITKKIQEVLIERIGIFKNTFN